MVTEAEIGVTPPQTEQCQGRLAPQKLGEGHELLLVSLPAARPVTRWTCAIFSRPLRVLVPAETRPEDGVTRRHREPV